MNSNNNLIIRRAVAVILMILTIVFLFWPAFVKLRAYGVIAEISLSKFRQFLGELSDYGLSVSFMNVITNIAFFGMIGLAAISVIAMAIGKSKAFTVLHTLLAILYALIALVDVGRGQIGTEEVPLSLGASLFLIPIFSLAASIVYQEGTPVPSADDNRWLTWTCPKCGTKNETKAQFCQHCGTQKPIPNTGKWVCPHCHESNSSSALFCISCGTEKPASKSASAPKPPVAAPKEAAPAKQKFCHKCGAAQEGDEEFCLKCGAKLY